MSDEEYQILKAVSGEEAIEKAKTLLPDLIIMDVVLPDIDGADAIKVLQESLEVQDIPALFLSSIVVKGNGISLQLKFVKGHIMLFQNRLILMNYWMKLKKNWVEVT